jgi:polysaccharide export outer membrane protein
LEKKTLIVLLAAIIVGTFPALSAGQGDAALALRSPGNGAATPAQEGSGERAAGPPMLQRRNPRYRLQTGDELEINFPLTPEYDEAVTVQPDGFINLHGLEDMHIAGMTTPELVSALKERYASLLNDPEITVVLKSFERPYFVAAGEFTSPGRFELKGSTTCLQAVAMAGGIKEGGKSSQVILFRRASDDWWEVKKINLNKIAGSQRLSEDLQIMPGDLLFVPRSTLSKLGRFIPTSAIGMYVDPFLF